MGRPLQAIIWDMDGTLVDTAELHFQAWSQICALLHRDFSRSDFIATFGRRNPEIMSILLGRDLDPQTAESWANKKEAIYRELTRQHGVQFTARSS